MTVCMHGRYQQGRYHRGRYRQGTPTRILHVAESAQGGVGTYLAEMLPFQIERLGADAVRVLLPDRHATHVSGVDRRVVRHWRRRGRSIVSMLLLVWALIRAERRFRPTIIHAHSSFAGVVVRLLYGGRGGRTRIVYCPHGWGFDRRAATWKRRLAAGIERALAGRCDRIVVISEHERQRGVAVGIPPDRLALVYNGIADCPRPRASRRKDRRLRLLFIGRLDHQKGIDTLLDAVEPFPDSFSVRIIGTAVAGQGYPRRAGASVERLGWRSLGEVASEIAAADVVVVPSRWEGFGLVALEAMRGGCAVVASAVGGLREIVVDEVTGRLVPPESPERLAHALLSGTREQWQAMGQAGRARFLERFTAARMNAELFALYGHVLGPDDPCAAALFAHA